MLSDIIYSAEIHLYVRIALNLTYTGEHHGSAFYSLSLIIAMKVSILLLNALIDSLNVFGKVCEGKY